MCGIVGAVNGNLVVDQLLTGLGRLEYRGYDSAGIAVLQGAQIKSSHANGKLLNLSNALELAPLDGRIGIAHTRWATHGKPSLRNAHPHITSKVAVVHNGIIENYRELRAELEASGHIFKSETDTEVVPKLITAYLEKGASTEEATCKALARLHGSYALGIMFSGIEDCLIAARRGSPLVIGIGENANYIASDSLALAGMAHQSVQLEDGDWAMISDDKVEIRDENCSIVQRPIINISNRARHLDKAGYRHYMKKEIHEQPSVIRQTLDAYTDRDTHQAKFSDLPFDLARISKLNIVACGTSCHAGLVAKYWFEKHANLPVEVDTASEFRYREPLLTEGGVSLFISQSGETADTLAAMRYAKTKGQQVIAMVNVVESTIAREADVILPSMAGPEIGVASTKAFTTQLTLLACLTIAAGRARGTLTSEAAETLVTALATLPNAIEILIEDDQPYIKIAQNMTAVTSALYVGRGTAFPVAVEGALKLKEISYIHAEGYGAGELKHGPIALIDEKMPVVVVAPHDHMFDKTASNLQEISARGGTIILISTQEGLDVIGNDAAYGLSVPDCDPFISPILYSVPLQMIAYHIAHLKGTDIDQPRNLAKSVTVE